MQSNLRWLLAFALPVSLSLAFPLSAQQAGAAATGRVIGRVIDQVSRRPVAGASVATGDGTVRAITDDQGRFSVSALPGGPVRLTFGMIGFAARTDSLTLRPGVTQELEVTLSQQAVQLDPIAITVRSGWLESSGFYEREQSNPGGTFITREEVERKQARQLTDLLREVPGLRTYNLDPGRIHVRFNRESANDLLAFDVAGDRSLPGCEPDLYLDGMLFRERAPSANVPRVAGFDIVDIAQVEGIESYVGPNAPLQYQHPCGVILVWTRRGTSPAGRTPSGGVATAGPSVGGAGPSPGTGRAMPLIDAGTLVRVRPRLGDRLTAQVSLVEADSLVVSRGGESSTFRLLDMRRLERDGGIARATDRLRRGGKWGFMLSVFGVAATAAVEEFQALGKREVIPDNSVRRPAYAMKVIGAGTALGALLGGTLWKYREWIEIPLR
jgi:hypothetical protein